jgi:uncharacterized caspase-like protein
MKRLAWGVLGLLAGVLAGEPAHAEKRVALVIGNSAYETISPLTNPKNDAALMARTLKSVGFEVLTATDVDVRAMGRAVRDFGKALRAAGKDAVGLFYYAGHGIQASGANYLLPVGAQIEDEADLRIDAFSAADVLAQMESAGNALNLVILDACRNNPFAGKVRSGGRGLARIEAASGSMIAFAAGPGQLANDGSGENSPYTAALVAAIAEPGLTVEQVFKKVRVKVESVTGGAQTPWEESSLRGEFYFSKLEPKPAPAPPPAPVVTAPQVDKDALFWTSVKDSTSPAMLQTYVDQYPDGTFSGLARVMIERLKAEESERERQETQKVATLTLQAVAEPDRPQTPSDMVALGLKYETGDGLAKDPAMAAKWYREAARSGSAEAKYRLGLLYYRGEGVGQSFTEAAVQILDAVKAKHTAAVDALTTATTLDDPEFLKAVQERLKTLGYYRSTVDGEWGPGSRSAIAALSQGKSPVSLDKSAGRQNTNSGTSRSSSNGPAASATTAKQNSGSRETCANTGIVGLFAAGGLQGCPSQ